ncbi:bifunctional 5,10-methylene-tetrahydrofolate dehydrogenase/5,10-methylene-tetrahydrofolate cyclohydrolase [bacterium]|nr:bifunctional 5,10-methylene-tetrahydrofolate dehydrogenase/5,10-methylene-tetrahydrofolate cyclohydrolase [bacterium]
MTTILNGKNLRDIILADLKIRVEKFMAPPELAVILVGENPASLIYVNNKKKTAEKLGIVSHVIKFPQNVSESNLIKTIKILNEKKSTTAILVQLPLPEHIDKFKVIDAIAPEKDVDGLTPYNSGKLFSGEKPFVYPCTPRGILHLLEKYHIEIEGKNVVVIGRSNLVGKPVAQMMMNKNATVTMCHSHSKNLAEITKNADILISAVGKKIITENMVKENCVVVDVGIFKDENGKTTGDVDFENVSKKAGFISPVPGGVGPMTIASLMLNTVDLYEIQHNINIFK